MQKQETTLTKPENHKCGIDCGGGAWCIYDDRRSTSVAYKFENANYNLDPRPWTTASTFGPGDVAPLSEILERANEILNPKSEVDYSTPFAEKVLAITDSIAELLVTKNQAYGNSALDPIRIFSKVGTQEGLDVRIDDKLSRIARGHEYPGDDTLKDLIGYLIMKLVERQNEEERE